MTYREKIIDRIFAVQGENGCWKMLPPSHKYYPDCLHYAPTFKATLWTLILLADLGHDGTDKRIRKPFGIIQDHFYDPEAGIYTIGDDHFPIPCLNGNMIYLDAVFNGTIGERSQNAVDFFNDNQRFDDGEYVEENNQYCKNKSCYGTHSCYWGVIKLLKGLSFVPVPSRGPAAKKLLDRCIEFVLLHKVCYRSRRENGYLTKGIDRLTFPNMYKGDFLEILWLLKRERVRSDALDPALDLLKSKRLPEGSWNLERKVHNLITTVGAVDSPNPFITQRANEVLDFYE